MNNNKAGNFITDFNYAIYKTRLVQKAAIIPYNVHVNKWHYLSKYKLIIIINYQSSITIMN